MESFITDDGKTIYYRVVDNYSEKPRIIRGVEKIGRFIHYYDEKQEFIKMSPIWGTYDEMQFITPILAKEEFER